MGLRPWREPFGLPSLLSYAALLAAAVVPATVAAGALGPGSAGAAPCRSESSASAEELAAAREAASDARVSIETVLNQRGEETGRRVVVEPGGTAPVVVSLPPESFAAGPFGGLLLYGWHTPATGSEVRGVNLETGCDVRLARPSGIVRSAVPDATGHQLYVHAVAEQDRRDAGVVRHNLVSGESASVVDSLPESDYFGPTFATSLLWSLDGEELAVQSCGFSRCRTRVLGTSSGRVESFDGAGHGALLGLDRAALFAYDACHWAPCGVLRIDRASGQIDVLVEEVYAADLVLDGEATRLTVETASGSMEVRP